MAPQQKGRLLFSRACGAQAFSIAYNKRKRKKVPMATHPLAYYVYRTPHGAITICVDSHGVRNVAFGEASFPADLRPTALSNDAATQIQEYLAGKRRIFDVPLSLAGSDFQRAVWDEIARIPYGEARTATDIARALGRPSGHRAVGAAVHANPTPLLIPDHRIVKAGGAPLAAGARAKINQGLLRLEQNRSRS